MATPVGHVVLAEEATVVEHAVLMAVVASAIVVEEAEVPVEVVAADGARTTYNFSKRVGELFHQPFVMQRIMRRS